MKTTSETATTVLNNLIEICRDGEKGYKLAADKEKNIFQGSLYREYARERMRFVSELEKEIGRIGDHPPQGGSVGVAATGAAHRGWMNVKSVATGNKPEAIIDECERGEDAAVKAYEEALKNDLPDEIRVVVESQYQMIKKAHARISVLKHANDK